MDELCCRLQVARCLVYCSRNNDHVAYETTARTDYLGSLYYVVATAYEYTYVRSVCVRSFL